TVTPFRSGTLDFTRAAGSASNAHASCDRPSALPAGVTHRSGIQPDRRRTHPAQIKRDRRPELVRPNPKPHGPTYRTHPSAPALLAYLPERLLASSNHISPK